MLPSAFRLGVSADDEILLLAEFDFNPRSGAFSRLKPEPLRLPIKRSSPSVRARSKSSGISLVNETE
jgi:hypothetical protein